MRSSAPRLASSLRLLAVITLAAFTAEALIMLTLRHMMLQLGTWSEAILDSALLVVMLLPTLYLFMVRPLELQIASRQKSETALQEAHAELEGRVRERTAELAQANQTLQVEIAERKQAEEKLAWLASAVEYSPATVVITDVAGNIEYVNPRFTLTTGYRFEEARGKNPRILRSGQTPVQVYEELWSTICAGGRWHGEFCNRKKNGELYWESASIAPITNDKGVITRFVAVKEDITERKRAEAQLEQLLAQVQQERERVAALALQLQAERDTLDVIMENTRAHLAYLDPQFNFIRVNSTYVEGSDHSRAELTGRNHFELFPHPENQMIFERVRATGQPIDFHAKPFEFVDQPERGITYWDWTLVPVKAADGEVQGLVLSLLDVTEGKRAEQQAQRLAALEERQRLARELHDSLSQTLYGIALGAHTALIFLDSERDKVVEALDYVLSLADAGLTDMRALIFDLRPESLEAEGLVSALAKRATALRARYGLEVKTEICEEPDVPLETKDAIYRVAQEALHNAVKHARANQLGLRLCHMRDTLVLEVSDDGAGFDPAQSFPGHFGLDSMRERVARLRGTLGIHSAPGSGTRVRAEFPLSLRTSPGAVE